MWKSPIKAMPSIVQVDFGPWGQNLPGDGEAYCYPTSIVMGLYWLRENGFTQVAPSKYKGRKDQDAINLELVIGGLLGTSSIAGTYGSTAGVTTYLAACGISPTAVASAGNPGIDWIAEQIAPNFASDPDSIVLAQFGVGWYQNAGGNYWKNYGGHVIVPTGLTPDGLAVNNPFPLSFFNVPNLPADVPQVVQIVPVPSELTLEYLTLPSNDYSQVISGTKGGNNTYWAILWSAGAWTIPASARPTTPGYQPATWTINQAQAIDTNGGILTVLAPVSGTGGFEKSGAGMLLFTNTNLLSGANLVSGGSLGSAQASGTPFGTGAVTLMGGTLQLGVDVSGPVTAAIASATGAAIAIGVGSNGLGLAGTSTYTVTIGGNSDGSTPNIARTAGGALIVAPGAGATGLGPGAQQVLVLGSGGNLPPYSDGLVEPWLLGQDNDAESSGFFLDYLYDKDEDKSGLVPATVASSDKYGIGSLPKNAIYDVVDQQTIKGKATATVAALEMSAGGTVDGADGTLVVGSGDVAGVIMNGGAINAGTLAFGAAEAVIYTSNAGGTIESTISGSGGLTIVGPGALMLAADNSATLSGSITVNAGTLIAGATTGSPTGSGDVTVNAGATFQVTGAAGIAGGPTKGTVSIGSAGVLNMDGGTLAADVTIFETPSGSSDPGGILEGVGTINGTATIGGVVQAGPNPGVLTFGDTATFQANSAIYWQLRGHHDDHSKQPLGTYWNVLTFNSPDSVIGTNTDQVSLFVDFSRLDGSPDDGDIFWQKDRQWAFMTFPNGGGTGQWYYENFAFLSGDFSTLWPLHSKVAWLLWTPLATRRTPDERWRAEAAARRTPHGRD